MLQCYVVRDVVLAINIIFPLTKQRVLVDWMKSTHGSSLPQGHEVTLRNGDDGNRRKYYTGDINVLRGC